MVSTFSRAGRLSSSVSPLCVLVIDDHAQSREVLRHVLVARGHKCIAVASLSDALRVLDAFAIDVVIYEPYVRAVVCAGLAHTLRERAAARGRSLRIVALSTQGQPPGFTAAEGVDAYIQKPFDAERLDAVLVFPDGDRR